MNDVIMLAIFFVFEYTKLPLIQMKYDEIGASKKTIIRCSSYFSKKVIILFFIMSIIGAVIAISPIKFSIWDFKFSSAESVVERFEEPPQKKINGSTLVCKARKKPELIIKNGKPVLKPRNIHNIINNKYVYYPLTSSFVKIPENWKDNMRYIECQSYKRRFAPLRYYFYLACVVLLFGFLFYLLMNIDNKKITKMIEKVEDEPEIKRKMIFEIKKINTRYFVILILILIMFEFTHNEVIKIPDYLSITRYSKITDKKLNYLSDKIKKLNIKTDKQLSEAIREGKIRVSDVLDSTLTIQIEDSRLDKSIKKELLDYYRQNYEKYRYRIINGYLIDFIHGKYR